MSEDFFKVLSSIKDEQTMSKFLSEVLTKKELRDLSLRWQLLCLIQEKMPQRKIATELGISLCKITRGSKILKDKNSITYSLLKEKGERPK